jgi:hypothetical protein
MVPDIAPGAIYVSHRTSSTTAKFGSCHLQLSQAGHHQLMYEEIGRTRQPPSYGRRLKVSRGQVTVLKPAQDCLRSAQ